MYVSTVVTAFAAIGLVAAQSSTKCSDSSATYTIASSSDATALASSCGSTINGNIEISDSATGQVALDGIEQLKGDLTCNNGVNITSISAGSLNSIGGDFNLQSMTIMSTLGMPQLTSVGSIKWITLNALQELTFSAGVTSAGSVEISDTQLNDLTGINLATTGSLKINNNLYLKSINMAITNVSGLIDINSNGQGLAVSFPDLIWAQNMTVRNASTVQVDALQTINGTIGIYSDMMTSLSAPNLTTVGGSLAIVANPNLMNISFPSLTTVNGGFTIANNTALQNITGLPDLATTGAISFAGNFSTASLPSLKNVKGTFNMQSSGPIDCSPFQKAKDNSVIKGTYTCKAKTSNPQDTGADSSSTSSGSPSASSSKSAAPAQVPEMMPLMVPAIVGLLTLAGGVFQLL